MKLSALIIEDTTPTALGIKFLPGDKVSFVDWNNHDADVTTPETEKLRSTVEKIKMKVSDFKKFISTSAKEKHASESGDVFGKFTVSNLVSIANDLISSKNEPAVDEDKIFKVLWADFVKLRNSQEAGKYTDKKLLNSVVVTYNNKFKNVKFVLDDVVKKIQDDPKMKSQFEV